MVNSPGGPLLLSATEDGVVNIYRWTADNEAKPLMLASSRYGWALIDEVGRFDGSSLNAKSITWTMNPMSYHLVILQTLI